MSVLVPLFFLLAAGVAGPSPQTLAVDGIGKCFSVPNDDERLVCFDSFAPAFSEKAPAEVHSESQLQPEEPGQAEVADVRQKSDTESRAAYGEPTVDPERPAAIDRAADTARVKKFERLPRSNKIRIRLDNGQVWQEIDGSSFRGSIQTGAEVSISERRFGGYQMKVPGRSAPLRVRRIK